MIYRFVVVRPDGTVDSGANYPGCSASNTKACDPQAFANLADAIFYAANDAPQPGETVVQVASSDEAFAIMAGQQQIDPAKIISGAPGASLLSNPLVWIGGALLAWKFLRL